MLAKLRLFAVGAVPLWKSGRRDLWVDEKDLVGAYDSRPLIYISKGQQIQHACLPEN